MLLLHTGGRSSHNYISDDKKRRIREDIERVRPFDREREKIEYDDRSTGSVFSGLDITRLEWFLERNRVSFYRSYPHKNKK